MRKHLLSSFPKLTVRSMMRRSCWQEGPFTDTKPRICTGRHRDFASSTESFVRLSSSMINDNGEIKRLDYLSETFDKLQTDTVQSAAQSFLAHVTTTNGNGRQQSMDKDFSLVIVLNRLAKNPQLGEALVKELYELGAGSGKDKWKPNRDHFCAVLRSWRHYDPPSSKRTQALVEWMTETKDESLCGIDIHNIVLATWAEKGNAERAQTYLEKMNKIKGLKLNRSSFSHVLDAWSVSKSPMAPKRAESILSWMHKRNIEPDSKCLLRTIECWASKARSQESLQRIESLLAQMKRRMIPSKKNKKTTIETSNDSLTDDDPSLLAQATLNVLDAYQNVGNAHRSEEILLRYVDEFRLDASKTIPPPTQDMCLNVLTTWSKSKSSRRALRAEKLFQRMEQEGDAFPRPDVACLTAVLHAFATSKQPNSAQRAEALIRRIEDRDSGEELIIEPNLMAWTCVLNAWAYANLDDLGRSKKQKTTADVHVEAERIHDEILARGMIPDRLVYGGLITAWGRSRNDKDSIFKVEEYFEKIKSLENGLLTVVEYTTVLQAYAKYLANHNGENSRMCISRVESLLDEMIESGIKPNALTFAAALKCVAASHITDRNDKAEMILDMMQAERIEMTTYMNGLAKKCFFQQKSKKELASDKDSSPHAGDADKSSSSAAFDTQVCVIGAGVIGLAVARALSANGHEVLLIDKATSIGSETSSRNSEVLHAGLYYPKGSFKAKFCVEGQKMIYKYCTERSIEYKKCGKLVVATRPGQFQNELENLYHQAQQNGVDGCKMITSFDVKVMEPDIMCVDGALYSPSTGVVDSHSLMLNMLADCENNGGTTVVLNTKVTDAFIGKDSLHLRFDDGTSISCHSIINCAGLWSDGIARLLHKNHDGTTTRWQPPRQYFALGHYMKLQDTPSPSFRHLIYPVPEQGGLGVHATIDWAPGSKFVKFGPNVQWVDPSITDPSDISLPGLNHDTKLLADDFSRAIQTYWPDLPSATNHLVYDYTGIRPKLSHPDLLERSSSSSMPFQDFMIADENIHGIPGLVHLIGIESPGLTSSMALARYISCLLEPHLRNRNK